MNLKEILLNHQMWLIDNNQGARADLSNADLSDADLSNANLSDADLSDADLSDADLSDADLSYANLSDANLSEANLSGANLSYANLSEANLSKANLCRANLCRANLYNANLDKVCLDHDNLSEDNNYSHKTAKSNSSSEGALKKDTGKVRMELLSPIAMTEIAKVLTFGAEKYTAHNWRNGFSWSRLLGAALRHLFAFIGGEDNDPETGLSHIAHLGATIMFLLEHIVTHKDKDDRYKQGNLL